MDMKGIGGVIQTKRPLHHIYSNKLLVNGNKSYKLTKLLNDLITTLIAITRMVFYDFRVNTTATKSLIVQLIWVESFSWLVFEKFMIKALAISDISEKQLIAD